MLNEVFLRGEVCHQSEKVVALQTMKSTARNFRDTMLSVEKKKRGVGGKPV